jgi:hypothetical protein
VTRFTTASCAGIDLNIVAKVKQGALLMLFFVDEKINLDLQGQGHHTTHAKGWAMHAAYTPLVQLHDMTACGYAAEIYSPTMTVDVQLWPAVCVDDAWPLRKHADPGNAVQRPAVGLVHVRAVHAVVA